MCVSPFTDEELGTLVAGPGSAVRRRRAIEREFTGKSATERSRGTAI
jgi:hypothetical protein